MRYYRPILALLLIALLGGACLGQAAHPLSSEPTTTKLEGVVVNALTGKPIARALVMLVSGRRAMLSGAQGEFDFDRVPAGDVSLQVQKPGFSQEGATNFRSASTFTVTAGLGKVIIKLVPECVISGQVMGSDGEPLEGVQIMVLHSDVMSGHRRVVPAGRGMATDEDGNFRIAGLAPGKYFVAVRAGNAARGILGALSSKRKLAYPTVVYYPSSPDMESATPLDLSAAQNANLQFLLKLGPAYKVIGNISGLAGWKQVNSPWLTDRSGQPLAAPDKFERESGNFEFLHVPPGNYQLRIGAQAESGQFVWSQRALTVDADVTGVKLALGSGINIPVLLRSELSGSPTLPCAGGATSKKDCAFPPVRVQLRSVESGGSSAYFGSEGGGDPGNLKIAGVSPGRYQVQVYSMMSGYVQSVRSGGTNLLRDELVVPSDGSVLPIEVTVRDDGGKVKIHVNSDVAGKTWAVLAPEFAPMRDPIVLDVEPGVDREYGGLAPGEYKVLAFDSTDGLEYANPDVLSRFGAHAARVTVVANSTASVGVDLVHKDE
jgi:carboxypeptidase family protein